MSGSGSRLVIAINADATGLSEAFGEASGQVEEFASTVSAASSQTESDFGRVSSAAGEAGEAMSGFKGFAAAAASALEPLGLALDAGKLASFGAGLFEDAAHLDNMASAAGVGSDALQAYRASAEEVGLSSDDADQILRRLTLSLGEATTKGGPAADAMQKLGLNFGDAKAGAETALPIISRGLLGVSDASERAKYETEIFGRSGQDIEPMLEVWAGGTDKLVAKQRDLGHILDSGVSEAARKANAQFISLWDTFKTGTEEAVVDLTTIFGGLVKQIGAANDKLTKWLGLKGGMTALGVAASAVPGGVLVQAAMQAPKGLHVLASSMEDQGPQAQSTAPPPKPAGGWPGSGNGSSTQNAAREAKQQAEQIISIDKQTNDAIIAGEQQLNASKLALGHESLAQFTQQELSSVKQKYDADLRALQQEEANGKISHEEYLAAKGLLDQQYANKVAQIGEQSALRQRGLDDKAFADFQKTQEDKVKAAEEANQKAFNAGRIGAQQQEQLDLGSLEAVKSAVDQEYASLTAGWDEESAAYKAELEKRLGFDKWYEDQKKAIEDKTGQEEVASWRTSNNAIMSAENSLVSDILTKRQSLGLDLVQVGEKFLEEEIQNQLKYWTQRGLFALEGISAEKMTEQGGLLQKTFFDRMATSSVEISQTQQTAAVSAGTAARTAVTSSARTEGMAQSVAAGSTTIVNDAYQAASGTYASISQIPIVGPFLAPAAAAAAFAAVMAFDSLSSFDVGAWELPRDTIGKLHAGEMVVPENFASGLRGAMGGAGSSMSTSANHTWNVSALDAKSFGQMLRTPAIRREMNKFTQEQVRKFSLSAG